MINITKENHGKIITSANEIVKLANDKKSIIYRGGIVPAAIIQNWPLYLVVRTMTYSDLYVYIPNVKIKKSFKDILNTPLLKLE